jgi:hypothetical protein
LELRYTDAAGRDIDPINELGAGEIGGMTRARPLQVGVPAFVSTAVTLTGGSTTQVHPVEIAQDLCPYDGRAGL